MQLQLWSKRGVLLHTSCDAVLLQRLVGFFVMAHYEAFESDCRESEIRIDRKRLLWKSTASVIP